MDPAADEGWHTYIDVIVRPRVGLSEGQRTAIEVDFGMKLGQLVLNCRKALAFYVLRQLQLDRPSDASIAEQPLELENPTAVSKFISAARKGPVNEAAAPPLPKIITQRRVMT